MAAAKRCHANVIVTFNEKDFPADVRDSFGLEAQHPDVFAENLFDLDQRRPQTTRTWAAGITRAILSPIGAGECLLTTGPGHSSAALV